MEKAIARSNRRYRISLFFNRFAKVRKFLILCAVVAVVTVSFGLAIMIPAVSPKIYKGISYDFIESSSQYRILLQIRLAPNSRYKLEYCLADIEVKKADGKSEKIQVIFGDNENDIKVVELWRPVSSADEIKDIRIVRVYEKRINSEPEIAMSSVLLAIGVALIIMGIVCFVKTYLQSKKNESESTTESTTEVAA